jgi:hypothetical protein
LDTADKSFKTFNNCSTASILPFMPREALGHSLGVETSFAKGHNSSVNNKLLGPGGADTRSGCVLAMAEKGHQCSSIVMLNIAFAQGPPLKQWK